jgi:iron complex outermembrane receptor protein
LKNVICKLIITALSILVYTDSLHAQKNTIVGLISNGNDLMVTVPVKLVNALDSTVVKFGSTDSNHVFRFTDVSIGNYKIAINVVGWKPVYSNVFTITDSLEYKLPPITLVPADYSRLATVNVSARKAFIEQKPGVMTINIDAALSNIGNSVMEVLVKSPGVFVDQNGTITLNGKRGILVMLDGKPTYLNGKELESYLKELSSLTIEKIEIMSTPPAKYDAVGGAGAINIVTKKLAKKGFNNIVTITHSQGKYAKSNIGSNMNYYIKRFNFFLNGSSDYGTEYLRIPGPQDFYDDKGVTYLKLDGTTFSETKNTSPALNVKGGVNYLVSPKTTVGMVLLINRNNTEKMGSSDIKIQNYLTLEDSLIHQNNYFTREFTSKAINLNLSHKLDDKDGLLTADLDYLRYTPIQTLSFNTQTFDADKQLSSILQQKGSLPFQVDIYSAKIDYSQVIMNDITLNIGVKSSYVTNDNVASYFILTDGNWSPNPLMSRRFLYKESINAGYMMVKKAYGDLEVQAGLRAENTNYRGNLNKTEETSMIQKDSLFTNSYLSLFPSASASYKITKDHIVSLNYARKVDRPNYYDLNPFIFYITPYTSLTGNADLKPQFTNTIELYYAYQAWLSATLSYASTQNAFENISYLTGQRTIIKPGNIGQVQNLVFSVSYRKSFTNWWSPSLFVQTTYSKLRGNVNEQKIEVASRQFSINLSNQFNLSKGWKAEISGYYRSRTNYLQGVYSPVWSANVAIAKSLWNDKLMAKVAVSDIFYSQITAGTDYLPGSASAYSFYTDSRRVALSVSYKFGNSQAVKSSNGNKSVQEAGRVK